VGWLKFPFIIFGMAVTAGVVGTLATIGYAIVSASTCTEVSPSYSIGNCKTTIVGIPLSWVHDVNSNIVTTIIGSIITFGGAVLALVLFGGALVYWIRSRKQPDASEAED
jgi:hypothetical protein